MPNLDGTGPDGKGPLTGRGAGNCKGATPNNRQPLRTGRRNAGRGQGRGARGGAGRGL